MIEYKNRPSLTRIDDAFGNRNHVFICVPDSAYEVDIKHFN
jgi:hypothetical protein